ncbi:MAG: helix-turn-helix domain-containing protein [Candidatus Gastranaerophilaceae bacterium]
MERKYKNSISLDEFMTDILQDEKLAREYLNQSFIEYINDGDFSMFFKALERVVKARMSIREFAKQAELDRANLYAIFNGKKKPQFRTVLKILNKLGYTLRVA